MRMPVAAAIAGVVLVCQNPKGMSRTARWGASMLIDVDEAHRILFAHVRAGAKERQPLRAALYRTLAEDVHCDIDFPPFDRSMMDGFAVRAADTVAAPTTLAVAGQIAAGAAAGRALAAGEAMQINTGAPLPRGADAVARLEQTELRENGSKVVVQQALTPGKFVTYRGTYARAGQTVLAAGTVLTPINVGAAATCGASMVTVYRRPTMAILPTGDELIDIDQVPAGAKIRNSNAFMLEALVRDAHASPLILGTARDDRDDIRRRMAEGRRCDVLCITGGVSVGAFDFVPELVRESGARILIEKLAIKPGRPALVALSRDGKLICALPGNPLSAFVGFELLVRPVLAALEGRAGWTPATVHAVLDGALPSTGNRRSYLPARACITPQGGWKVRPLAWQGSGDALGAATANALIARSPNDSATAPGDSVSVILLERL